MSADILDYGFPGRHIVALALSRNSQEATMRRPVLTGFLLAVAALAHSAATGSDVGGLPGASATRQAEASPLPPVDTEFSIAVDSSYSMDPDELATTRRLSQALVSPEFLRALKNLRYRRLR